jgi:hypothetical protein
VKIISNFKDYYDHIQGQYGIDEKVTYERICQTKEKVSWRKTGVYKPLNDCLYLLAVCGVLYPVVCIKDKAYYFYEDLPKELRRDYYRNLPSKDPRNNKSFWKETNLNEKEDCPIGISRAYSFSLKELYVKNIRLRDFDFHKIIDAHTMYLKIVEFLTRDKTIVIPQTDKQKIESHGFDNKTSFRNM